MDTGSSDLAIYILAELDTAIFIKNNIIKGIGYGFGILFHSSNQSIGYVSNNIIYNFDRGIYSYEVAYITGTWYNACRQ